MNGFDYFKLALSKYTDFEGRSRRSEYWYFALFQMIIVYGIMAVETMILGITIISMLASLAFVVPGLAVAVRRLHDIGKSGWNFLFALIPIVGWILVIVWLATDSQYGANKWGPNPKGEGNEGTYQETVTDHLIDDDSLV